MKVKICGITCVEDAVAAARAGADAIGLNFYTGSARYVDPGQAAEIVRALPPFVEPVGLFVNAASDEIRRVTRQVGLSSVQLHGDEPPELLAELSVYRLIRTVRLGNEDMEPIADTLQRCRTAGRVPDGVLVDARVEGQYGGTGRAPSWSALASGYDQMNWPPLILAGGLTPENVGAAIEQVGPWAVDVSSGVEDNVPGRKSLRRVEAFLAEARAAFHQVRVRNRSR